jgi:hypothetical protein
VLLVIAIGADDNDRFKYPSGSNMIFILSNNSDKPGDFICKESENLIDPTENESASTIIIECIETTFKISINYPKVKERRHIFEKRTEKVVQLINTEDVK